MSTDGIGEAHLTDTWNYPLFPAIARRRSRRFPVGAVSSGLTPYVSAEPALPLADLEEALVVTAANGATGAVLPDDLLGCGLDYTMGFRGRAYSSPCASHGTTLFVSNDDGVFLVHPVPMADRVPGELADRYLRSRVRIADDRLDIPMSQPETLPSNSWNLNKPGTTLLMPVTDVTHEYINLLLMMLDAPNRTYIYDDLNGGAEPLVRYADKLDRANSLPLSAFELDVAQCTAATEQALMLQNAFLATQALGLGGWLLSPSDPATVLARLGLAPGRSGLIEPCRPPYVATMADAVNTVISTKRARYESAPTTLRADVISEAKPASDWCIDAVRDLCTYIWATYGTFPARIPPVQMVTWFQAHHLDTGYYDTYYQAGAYHETIRDHRVTWHGSR